MCVYDLCVSYVYAALSFVFLSYVYIVYLHVLHQDKLFIEMFLDLDGCVCNIRSMKSPVWLLGCTEPSRTSAGTVYQFSRSHSQLGLGGRHCQHHKSHIQVSV